MTIFLSTLSFKLHMICKAPLWWPIAANQKNKNKNNEMKNEIKKIKTIIKKKTFRKKSRKIIMAHECQI